MYLDNLKKLGSLTETENGAIAHSTTLNACLDAFSLLGTMRNEYNKDEIQSLFSKAFHEDPKTAMHILFYIRDIRGGQGARLAFRTCLAWLGENYKEYILNNLDNIIYYGRGDDYLVLLDNKDLRDEISEYLLNSLERDYNKSISGGALESLLAKWLPSEKASSKTTKAYAKILISYLAKRDKISFSSAAAMYRSKLSYLRKKLKVVERDMSLGNWDKIEYDKLPSKAGLIYSDAFYNHDEDGYTKYINELANGKAANSKTLYPYEIVAKASEYNIKKKDRIFYDALWKSLPNYFENVEDNAICMVDTSGSMSGIPFQVAVSLGIYCAERLKGTFQNYFLTFAEKPSLVKVVGSDIVDKINNMKIINAGNTDIESAFELLLEAAIKDNLPQEEMPTKLYILSDMQFDQARTGYSYWNNRQPKEENVFMNIMKKKYEDAGYTLPMIIYWNLRASDCGMFQATFQDQDVAIVGGFSPSLFKDVLNGVYTEETVNEKGEKITRQHIDPMDVMMKTVYGERYDRVWAET